MLKEHTELQIMACGKEVVDITMEEENFLPGMEIYSYVGQLLSGYASIFYLGLMFSVCLEHLRIDTSTWGITLITGSLKQDWL